MKWFTWVVALLMVFATMAGAMAENETNATVDDTVVVIGGDDVSDDNDTVEDGGNETEEEPLIELDPEVEEEAGIGPDQPVLWGLERAIERISLSLTFGRSAKARKGLAHARERLMEVQAMIAAKRLAKAGVAQDAYEDIMDEVEQNVAEAGNGAEEELADELEMEAELEEQGELLGEIRQLKEKVRARLTVEEQQQIQSLVQSLNMTAEGAKVKVQARKDKVKIKIKAQTGLSDEELNALEEQIRNVSNGNELKVRIKQKIKEARGSGNNDDSDDEESQQLNMTRGNSKPKKNR